MKRFSILLLGLLVSVGTVWGKNYEVTKKADDYTVKIEIDKNPPVQGNNNTTLTITDASAKKVTDAKVKIDYGMPAMPGMPAMNYKADAALKGDEYKAVMNFSMGGSWNIIIQITRGDKVKKVRLNVDVK
jgi:hypothetical protein